MMGRPEEALALHHEALALARSVGDRDGVARLLNSVASDLERLGRYDEAASAFRECAGLALGRGQHPVWAMARRNAALCFLRAGALAQTWSDLVALDAGTPAVQPLAWMVRAELDRTLGRLDAAATWAERVLEKLADDVTPRLTPLELALQRGEDDAFGLWCDGFDRLLGTGDAYLAAEHVVAAALWAASDLVRREVLMRYPMVAPVNRRHVCALALAQARSSATDAVLDLPDLPLALECAPPNSAAVLGWTWLAAQGHDGAETRRARLLRAMSSGLPPGSLEALEQADGISWRPTP